ncbi:MAG: hypothetical protein EX271_04965 [Acidimicrobiales bacterium]|nr:MAG: hypothetical protein EX271_04965 [Acidimicrobiales bacterium]
MQTQESGSNDICVSSDIHDILMADSARLELRTTEMNERQAALQELEKTLKVQLTGIESANAELDKKIATLKAGANEDLAHLVAMYQTMKPKQAATIFDSMDPAFAAGFLREMNSNAAGLIMANMNAKKSYTISVLIAQKNAKYR